MGFIMFSVVYTTTGTMDEAKNIARALVEERLAACVNLHPIHSVYRWQGEVEESEEIALSIKTTSDKIEQIKRRVKELHSYEVPALIAYPIERGLQEYLEWIRESTEG